MAKDNFKTPGFEVMLLLFSADRHEAGEKYEQMRRGLERYFRAKGCTDPQSLTDITFERVCENIDKFDTSRNTKLSSYFYGFASKIVLEHHRERHRETSLSDSQFIHLTDDEDEKERRGKCLDRCLDNLPSGDKDVVIRYFTFKGPEKAELRRQMCADLDCTPSALQTRIFRIKAVLRQCMESCFQKNP